MKSPAKKISDKFDTVIIGGGPAGLSASIYLARFNRSVLVVDANEGRTETHAVNENFLGFPEGIHSKNLRSLAVKQAKKFHVKFAKDQAVKIKKITDGFNIKGVKQSYKGKTLIFATGVKDLYPSFPGLHKYLGKSLFWCIICDGIKAQNKKVAVVGHDDAAAVIATKFLSFTTKVVFLTNCDKGSDHLSDRSLSRLEKAKIKVIHGSVVKVNGTGGMMKEICLDTGEIVEADYMFNKQGYVPRSELSTDLEVILEGEGFIKVDKDQKTNISGVYAVGDVTDTASHQIVTAAHQGSIAAISINEDLLLPFQKE